jgi:hypothetical protein
LSPDRIMIDLLGQVRNSESRAARKTCTLDQAGGSENPDVI